MEKSSTAMQKKLQVNTTKLTTAVRKKSSAADKRESSVSFGIIALSMLALEIFLITLGDVITVVLYIKRKLVQMFCVSPGTDNKTRGKKNKKKERKKTSERASYSEA